MERKTAVTLGVFADRMRSKVRLQLSGFYHIFSGGIPGSRITRPEKETGS
jgi:hypothetical protein